jgi:K+-sensing histidine kinase KdpD
VQNFLVVRASRSAGIRGYAEAALFATASTIAGLLIAPRWGNSAVDLLFLPTVVAAAALGGRGPGLFAAILSALAYNFFFTQPYHTFVIHSPSDIVTVIVLFAVALVTSHLAASVRTQADIAQAHAARNATIAGLARRLLSCTTEQEIADVGAEQLASLFDCNAIMVTGVPQPKVIASAGDAAGMSPSDIVAAALTLQTGEPAGRGARIVDAASWQFHATRSESRILAAAGLARDDGSPPLDAGQRSLLENLLDQIALALERARAECEARDLAALRERDRIRSTLLSTIGQDVAPRLAAIKSAIADLRRSGTSEKAPLAAIGSETSKLERYISNLVELGPASEEQPIQAGDVTVDLFRRIVLRGTEEVHLSPKEFAVLAELAKHPGRVLTHAHLLRTAWGPAQETQTEYLRVAIRSLRQKLEADPSRPKLILNEPAVGYRLATG